MKDRWHYASRGEIESLILHKALNATCQILRTQGADSNDRRVALIDGVTGLALDMLKEIKEPGGDDDDAD